MITVQQFHDAWFREHYDIIPKASAHFLASSIPTRDSARIRTVDPPSRLFDRERRMRSRDEVLEPLTSGKTIGLGTQWTGAGVNPQLDEKTAPIRDFVSGFVPGNIVHAESPGKVISLGRVYLPELQDEERREALTRALDEAEAEWKKDKRSNGDNPAGDLPPGEKTKDARPMVRPRNYLPGTNSGITGQQYQDSLRKGRETRDQDAPARVKSAADYAATLRAGRAAKA